MTYLNRLHLTVSKILPLDFIIIDFIVNQRVVKLNFVHCV